MPTKAEQKHTPIRRIVGIGNNRVQGIGILYEDTDQKPGFLNVWIPDKHEEDKPFHRIHFIDEGPEEIVWIQKEKGLIGKKTVWMVVEIRIRRDTKS